VVQAAVARLETAVSAPLAVLVAEPVVPGNALILVDLEAT